MLATLNQSATDLGILKRQHALGIVLRQSHQPESDNILRCPLAHFYSAVDSAVSSTTPGSKFQCCTPLHSRLFCS